jgi:hypothetical protein
MPPPFSFTRCFYLIGICTVLATAFSEVYEILTAPHYIEGLPSDVVKMLLPEILEPVDSHHDFDMKKKYLTWVNGTHTFLDSSEE